MKATFQREKTEGLVTMISSIISREFCFTFNFLSVQWWTLLAEVIKEHESQKYLSKDSGINFIGTTWKPPLNKNPFCRDFDHGKKRLAY